MKFSIIIPIYNEARNIQQTIKRLSNILNKKKIVYEILFIDDDSKDNSIEIFKKFKTKKTKLIIRETS